MVVQYVTLQDRHVSNAFGCGHLLNHCRWCCHCLLTDLPTKTGTFAGCEQLLHVQEWMLERSAALRRPPAPAEDSEEALAVPSAPTFRLLDQAQASMYLPNVAYTPTMLFFKSVYLACQLRPHLTLPCMTWGLLSSQNATLPILHRACSASDPYTVVLQLSAVCFSDDMQEDLPSMLHLKSCVA